MFWLEYYNKIWLTIVVFAVSVHFYLYPVSGGPIPKPVNYTCSSSEVGRLIDGRIKCLKLSSYCPIGYGLSVKLGQLYPAEERISCDSCTEGLTYSDQHDFSQCKNCTTCGENEVSVGQCTPNEDSITCECKSGYYRSNGLVSQCLKCKPCADNEFPIGECTRQMDNSTCQCIAGYYRSAAAGHVCTLCADCCRQELNDCNSLEAKNCSVKIACHSRTSSISPTSTASDHITDHRSKLHESEDDATARICLVVFIGFVTLISLGLLFYVYLKHNGINLQPKGRSRSICDPYKVTKGYLPVCDRCDGSEASEAGSDTPHSPNMSKSSAPNQQAASKQQAASVVLPIPPTRDFEATSITLNTEVVQLPNKVLKHLCNVLDSKDPYYRDCRFLVQELGMKQEETSSLDDIESRTHFVLKVHKVTVAKFLEILATIIQVSSTSVQQETSPEIVTRRAHDLAQIEQDVRSLIGH